jgi:hypothetical protein
MAAYLPLMRIDVGHGFYAGGRCPGLRWVPSADTAAWLRASGAVVRESESALALYGTAQALAMDPAAVLAWQLHVADSDFATATDDPAQRPAELLYLDAAHAVPEVREVSAATDRADATGAPTASAASAASASTIAPPPPVAAWRLHAGPTVSTADVRPLTWPLVAQALQPAQRRMPPLALLRVPLAALAPPPVVFRLQLAARATVWKYCLHGDWPEPALQVVDLAQEAEFDAPAPDRLDNGRPMLAIRSHAPIALSQRSAQRFQLRSRQRSGDKVLVARLPVAAAQFLAREQIGGASRLVSEIHLHR